MISDAAFDGSPHEGERVSLVREAADLDAAREAGEPTSWGGFVYRLLRVKDEIGWEPFRETYAGFPANSETKAGRLALFLDELSEHADRDIRALIPGEELDWVLDRLE